MNDGLFDLVLTSADHPKRWNIAQISTTTDGELSLRGDTQDWVIEATKKLDALARRQRNWDSYGGLPLRPDAKSSTLNVLQWLKRKPLPVPSIVLSSAGTVHLEWRALGKELDVELGDGPKVDYVKVMPNGDIQEGRLNSSFPSRVRDLSEWLLEKQ